MFISKFSNAVSILLHKIANKISSINNEPSQPHSVQSIRVKPWFEAMGDKTLRLNYDLDENSTVFDLGGYEGQWASDIFGKYGCYIHIFEPHPQYAENIVERFQSNKKIFVHSFGLTKNSNNVSLSISADSSSLFKDGNEAIQVAMKDTTSFFYENQIGEVHLMKINIEGGEYDLLEDLLNNNLILRIKNIQVQFHDFVENADARMRAIQNQLELTHYLTYQYEFVWENWERKDHGYK